MLQSDYFERLRQRSKKRKEALRRVLEFTARKFGLPLSVGLGPIQFDLIAELNKLSDLDMDDIWHELKREVEAVE
jgi:hypothetical protein